MKKHFYILFFTFLILIANVVIFFIAKREGLFGDKDTLISTLLIMVLALFFPIAFYTCYRLVYDDNKKGHILAKLIEGTTGEAFGGLFIVPFLLSPIFIYDYILYFLSDLRKFRTR